MNSPLTKIRLGALILVGVFTMVPVWNDLWFPLILAPGESTKTVTLGVQVFLGQFVSDWRGMTAMSVLMLIPAVIFVALVQRQLMEGLTSGATKG